MGLGEKAAVLSYQMLGLTTFKYRFNDFETKTLLTNSALESGITYTPGSVNTSEVLI